MFIFDDSFSFTYNLNIGYCFSDITPPQIHCPENIVMGTESDEDYALVNWTVPIATGKLESGRNIIKMCQEESSIFWEVIVSVILSKKKMYMYMYPIPNGF
jgi:hypothetical protein